MAVGLDRLDGEDRRRIEVVPEERHHLAGVDGEVGLDQACLAQQFELLGLRQRLLLVDLRPGELLVEELAVDGLKRLHSCLVPISMVCSPVRSS